MVAAGPREAEPGLEDQRQPEELKEETTDNKEQANNCEHVKNRDSVAHI
jgi:hypothetical protein